MDTAKYQHYSDEYLKELRAAAVKRVDDARRAVARGAIGRTRVHARHDIEVGRAERDAIDTVLARRVQPAAEPEQSQPQPEILQPTEKVYEETPDRAFVRGRIHPDRHDANAFDEGFVEPPEVPRRGSQKRKAER